MKFLTVVGARPQFIKAGPLSLELRKRHREVLVHTGQHYDYEMSKIFFRDLGLPKPDYHLEAGSHSHGKQTAIVLERLEKVLLDEKPDAVIVYGDTNSTLAGALAAAKLHIPIAHVEAGLRSFNRAMPEEINRVMTDHVSTWLFTPSADARRNLKNEGVVSGVSVVGDIMLDALLHYREKARAASRILKELALERRGYYLATIHRAENTDDRRRLSGLLSALSELDRPVVLPLHPRTAARLKSFGQKRSGNIRFIRPVGYLDMIQLESEAACILTDSGGVQKEAYYLKTPCVTLRDETEWVETVRAGWNIVAGTGKKGLLSAVARFGRRPPSRHPSLYGDGRAAQRIVKILNGK